MAALKQYPSQEYLRQCFDERDGKLFWRARPREHFKTEKAQRGFNTEYAGKEAGIVVMCHANTPRHSVTIHRKMYYRSRLVWIYHNGTMPPMIDHHDHNTLNDRIDNLRAADVVTNGGNRKINRNNRSGIKGVSWNVGHRKWRASIKFNKTHYYLGSFDDILEAKKAYDAKARELFGEFACAG